MTDLLVSRAASGIRVRILLPDPIEDPGWEIVGRLQAAGIEVRELDDPYGHAKAILVDGISLFIGSQNLTKTSLDENRELGIVTDDRGVIARLTATFARDFAASPVAAWTPDATFAGRAG
jgi:phosphatidylserine/phosphatidylglycerophosphate/cardiolipin synthase-like enzyme